MSYSIDQILTVAECDALLAVMGKEKSDVLFRKTSLERQKEAYATHGTEIDAQIIATNAEVTALQGVVLSLPAGNAKTDNEIKLRRLELKQFLLLQKDKDFGSVSLLVREFE